MSFIEDTLHKHKSPMWSGTLGAEARECAPELAVVSVRKMCADSQGSPAS